VVSRGCVYAECVLTLSACSNSSSLTRRDLANVVVRNRTCICSEYAQNKGRRVLVYAHYSASRSCQGFRSLRRRGC
jgi:hypothetical protein